MKVKSEEPVFLEKYNKISSENKYLGSTITGNKRLENNLDEIWYYDPLYSVNYSSANRDDEKWSSIHVIL